MAAHPGRPAFLKVFQSPTIVSTANTMPMSHMTIIMPANRPPPTS